MSITPYDITIYEGVTLRLQITRVDPSGTPIDLTGATYAGAIATARDGGTVLLNLALYVVVSDPACGRLALEIPASVTQTFVDDNGTGRWPYDLLATLSGGDTVRLLTGQASAQGVAT